MKLARIGKCSKCGKLPYLCVEVVAHTSDFDVKPEGTLVGTGYHFAGDHIKLEAQCRCGHYWTVRSSLAVRLLQEKID